MGAMSKENQTLLIQIDGSGPVGKIITKANAQGEVKGFITNPHVHASTKEDKLAVGYVVGTNGFIRITKDLKVKELFTSSAKLQTGEIGDDFTYYFMVSEQIPSSVGLGVLVNDDNSVLASGGFILQVLPGATDEIIQTIETNILSMKSISSLIQSGFTPEEIVKEITKGNHEFMETMNLQYICDCNQERFAKGIFSLGKSEIEDMIKQNEPIEITCEFCKKNYFFTVEDLKKFISL